jgi:hypothetical protein
MQREFSVRVADASRAASPPWRGAGVLEKVDYALAETRRGVEQAQQRKLVARTIEMLRARGRAQGP